MPEKTAEPVDKSERRAHRPIQTPKARRNYKPHDWTSEVRRAIALLFIAETLLLLLANPYFEIRHIEVRGAHRLTIAHVLKDAGVRKGTNIFLALFKPIQSRLAKDPEIDHSQRLAILPNSLLLEVTERQPRVILQAAGQYWMVDPKGIPFELVPGPSTEATTLKYTGPVGLNDIVIGKPITQPWLKQAFQLMRQIEPHPELRAQTIVVDQNMNICLNRGDQLQIKLGQPDSLPAKLTVASKIILNGGERIASTIAYVDVSSPGQPAVMPRNEDDKGSVDGNDRGG